MVLEFFQKKIVKRYNWQELKHPLCLEMILRPIKDGIKSREIPVRWKKIEVKEHP